MKIATTFFTIACASVLLLLTACGQKVAPLKEGVITKVVWASDEGGKTGLYRGKMPETPQPGQGGSYNVDMYGLLYPSHLEVRFVGSRDSRAQIIPFSQVVWLEFGDGGIAVSKQ
jgi:hypothetical protein